MTIKVILTQNVPGVGEKGDILYVSRGYARNFLIPKKAARIAGEKDIAASVAHAAEEEKQREKELGKMKDVKAHLFKKHIALALPSNDQGTLYRAVAPKDIADALYATYGVNFPASSINMATIKTVGAHDFTIALKDQGEIAMRARIKAL